MCVWSVGVCKSECSGRPEASDILVLELVGGWQLPDVEAGDSTGVLYKSTTLSSLLRHLPRASFLL